MSTAMIPEMVVKRYFDTMTELPHGIVVTASLSLEQGID
jgi:hypothetical protein